MREAKEAQMKTRSQKMTEHLGRLRRCIQQNRDESELRRRNTIMNDERKLEQEIQAKGLSAPRLTPDQIDGKVARSDYWIVPNTTCTVCAITLQNGYVVTGESAAASPENFDERIGRQIAFKNAREKIWALEGYLLRQTLHDKPPTDEPTALDYLEPISGTKGKIDGRSTRDGQELVRIQDHWFPASAVVPA
jgi:hypothetical protein